MIWREKPSRPAGPDLATRAGSRAPVKRWRIYTRLAGINYVFSCNPSGALAVHLGHRTARVKLGLTSATFFNALATAAIITTTANPTRHHLEGLFPSSICWENFPQNINDWFFYVFRILSSDFRVWVYFIFFSLSRLFKFPKLIFFGKIFLNIF